MIATPNPITNDAITETYQDIQNLIYDVVWKFKKAHGGDFDEMVSEANVIYMDAYLNHNPNRANFTSWLYRKLIWGLSERHRTLLLKNHREQTSGEMYEFSSPTVRRPFYELLTELGQDARTIVELILEMPEVMEQNALSNGTTPRNIQSALHIYLKTFFGWTEKHVLDTFREIAEVINA